MQYTGHLGAYQDIDTIGAFPNAPSSTVAPTFPRINHSESAASGLIGAWSASTIYNYTLKNLTGNYGTGVIVQEGSTSSYSWEYDIEVGASIRFENQTETNAYSIHLGTYDNASGTLSIYSKIYFDAVNGASPQCIVDADCSESGALGRAFQFREGSANLQFVGFVGGSATTISGSTTLSTGVWYDAVVTCDGTDCRIYLDGTLDGTGSLGLIDNDPAVVCIGARALALGASLGEGLNGRYSDARLWNRALSATEVSGMHANPWALYSPTTKPLSPILDASNPLSDKVVFDFALDEGGGPTLTNLKGGYHATGLNIGAESWSYDDVVGPHFKTTDYSGHYRVQNTEIGIFTGSTLAFWFKNDAGITGSSIYFLGNSYFECSTEDPNNTDISAHWVSNDFNNYYVDLGLSSDPGVSDGSWHHVAFTYGPTGRYSYLDGTLAQVATGVVSGHLNSLFNIGAPAYNRAGSNPFVSLARVTLFNEELHENDIADLALDPWYLWVEQSGRRKPTNVILDESHELYTGLLTALPFIEATGAYLTDYCSGFTGVSYQTDNWRWDEREGWYFRGYDTSSRVQLYSPFKQGHTGFSLALRIKSRSIDSHDSIMYIPGVVDTRDELMIDRPSTTRLSVQNQCDWVNTFIYVNTIFQTVDDAWHWVVVTVSGDQMQVYQNGYTDNPQTLNEYPLQLEGATINLFSGFYWPEYPSKMSISDLRIWDRWITTGEVERLISDPWSLYGGIQPVEIPSGITGFIAPTGIEAFAVGVDALVRWLDYGLGDAPGTGFVVESRTNSGAWSRIGTVYP